MSLDYDPMKFEALVARCHRANDLVALKEMALQNAHAAAAVAEAEQDQARKELNKYVREIARVA